MVAGLKKRSGNNLKGGIYISCIARGPHMFGEANAEMKIIESILGNIPIIGLYANGEISNNRLYSYTGVLTLFT
jgi:small ligand-binding sensory domain FIST